MEKVIEELNGKAKKLEHMATSTDIALTEMRIQFETLAEMQKEERLSMQKMYNESVENLSEKHSKEISHWKHICIGLIVSLCIFIGGLFGTVAYFLLNFDFAVETYQEVSVGGDGNPEIHDGIHINDN